MIYAILKGDELWVYKSSQVIYNENFHNFQNKNVQVIGNVVRLIGEAMPGIYECRTITFDENGNFVSRYCENV